MYKLVRDGGLGRFHIHFIVCLLHSLSNYLCSNLFENIYKDALIWHKIIIDDAQFLIIASNGPWKVCFYYNLLNDLLIMVVDYSNLVFYTTCSVRQTKYPSTRLTVYKRYEIFSKVSHLWFSNFKVTVAFGQYLVVPCVSG